ncbi:helix-turn-helix domain-containing protein [Actinomadura verrucosospora]|uniref:Regulator of polyketide synthase expression n=1 Tax=Actinomadura verrucosospora TaxID=46165 RepID=A0A7D3VZ77_ACTVE|nr:PucR family transcriptional regulator [Actinomadura verrucosospora]QKG27100.1 Regulator of polyketide synthase expression [Actinomadura verrucosospora]
MTAVPPHFAELMWPEMPSVIQEIIRAIRSQVPAYDRPEESAYLQVTRLGVETLVRGFITWVADPSAPTVERNATARALGHFEAVEGRTLDELNAAFRIALRVCWHRTAEVAWRDQLPADVIAAMAEAMIRFIDEVSEQTVIGYRSAQAQADLARKDARTALLTAILQRGRAVTGDSGFRALALAADWVVPAQVTPVVVGPGTKFTRSALDPDVLADTDSHQPCLLIPGKVGTARLAMLSAVLEDAPSVVGCTVPTGQAPDALRWARRVLALGEARMIGENGAVAPLTRCDDHLVTVLLASDPSMTRYLAACHLAPFSDLTSGSRQRLLDTLREWVTSRGSAVEVAERLGIHPQTVRYRLRLIEELVGEQMQDPTARFVLELTLRAAHLQRRR